MSGFLTLARRHLARLRRCERGNIAMLTGLMIIPFLLMAGMAIDLSRVYIYKQRLSTAVDMAGLAAGSYEAGNDDTTEGKLEAFAKVIFEKNMEGADGTVTAFDLTYNGSTKTITVTADGDVSMTLMRLAAKETMAVSESAEVVRETSGMEVVLALDNTYSMNGDNIANLKVAAQDVVDTLFGSQTNHPLLRVGIVPWVVTVNAGVTLSNGTILAEEVTNQSLTQTTPYLHTGSAGERVPYDATANQTGSNGLPDSTARTANGWAGCLMQRSTTNDRDIDDTPPAAGGWFAQYYVPDDNGSNWRDEYSKSQSGQKCWKQAKKDYICTDVYRSGNTTSQRGPNYSCPSPMTPLTNSKTKVDAAIDKLTAWQMGGTNGLTGLSWAYRLLSPDSTFLPTSTTLGMNDRGSAWDDPDWDKVVIFMTDGDTNSINGQYTAYGDFGDQKALACTSWEISSGKCSESKVESWVNTRLGVLCTKMKNDGIKIYTVVFEDDSITLSSATKNVYKNCATAESMYYFTKGTAALKKAFSDIGAELSNLRLSK